MLKAEAEYIVGIKEQSTVDRSEENHQSIHYFTERKRAITILLVVLVEQIIITTIIVVVELC